MLLLKWRNGFGERLPATDTSGDQHAANHIGALDLALEQYEMSIMGSLLTRGYCDNFLQGNQYYGVGTVRDLTLKRGTLRREGSIYITPIIRPWF